MNHSIDNMRLSWIDIAKGVGILLVILGHSIGSMSNPINRVILSFHMPLFFFLSGYLFHKNQIKFNKFMSKKVNSLLLSHLILVFFKIGWDTIRFAVYHVGTINGIVSNIFFWFLPVMFICNIIFWFIAQLIFSNDRIKQIIWIAVLMMYIILIQKREYIQNDISTVFAIVPMALLFFSIGYFVKINLWSEFLMGKNVFITFLMYLMVMLIGLSNEPVGMYVNYYGNMFLFIVGALAGTYCIIQTAKIIKYNRAIEYIGKYSIVMFVLHFFVLDVLKVVLSIFIPSLGGMVKSVTLFIITVLILIPMIEFCRRYLWFMFGMRRKIKN